MNPLQYTSEEMFSSTELIRKSKMVFDKLQKNDIEKAIILRDGKPSFMLLDFSQYEEIMSEYLSLKEILENQSSVKAKPVLVKIEKEAIKIQEEDLSLEESFKEDDFETALAQIDELDLDNLDEKKEDKSKEALKEFWE